MSVSHSISMSHTISQSMCLRMSSDNGNIGNLSHTISSAVVDLDLTKKQVGSESISLTCTILI